MRKPGQPPFHPGEREMQELAGIGGRMSAVGPKIIRNFISDDHRQFFAELPFVVASGLDAADRPWGTVLSATPGFVSAEPELLRVRALPGPSDPLAAAFEIGEPVGILGIEFATRSRIRLNGTVRERSADGFAVAVKQSFGNCSQYIQARSELKAPASGGDSAHSFGALLEPRAERWIEAADTFFIATSSADPRGAEPSEGLDVSHRGGKPGFVRVSAKGGMSVLSVPDFRGNFMFNTLGNLRANPRAGLAFVDFDSGSLLTLTGTVEVVFDGPELASFVGAERLWHFTLACGHILEGALPFRWTEAEWSPHLARTGAWSQDR